MGDLRPDHTNPQPVSGSPSSAGPRDVDENVFEVLARQARTRTSQELGATTAGAIVSASLIWWHDPALSWLAAGFVATAAYGAWGLLDRVASQKTNVTDADRGECAQLTWLRDLAAILGTGAALWAVLDFMAAALGGWRH